MSKELEKTHKPILVTDSNGVHYEVVFDFPYSPPEIECNVDINLITSGVGRKSIETPVELLAKTSEKKISKIEKL